MTVVDDLIDDLRSALPSGDLCLVFGCTTESLVDVVRARILEADATSEPSLGRWVASHLGLLGLFRVAEALGLRLPTTAAAEDITQVWFQSRNWFDNKPRARPNVLLSALRAGAAEMSSPSLEVYAGQALGPGLALLVRYMLLYYTFDRTAPGGSSSDDARSDQPVDVDRLGDKSWGDLASTLLALGQVSARPYDPRCADVLDPARGLAGLALDSLSRLAEDASGVWSEEVAHAFLSAVDDLTRAWNPESTLVPKGVRVKEGRRTLVSGFEASCVDEYGSELVVLGSGEVAPGSETLLHHAEKGRCFAPKLVTVPVIGGWDVDTLPLRIRQSVAEFDAGRVTPAHSIFLSYRRSDDVGRLRAELADHFGVHSVFYDVSSIDAGVRLRSTLEASVSKSKVLVVAIGPTWDPARLNRPDDYVHFEISVARRHQLPVFVILVGNTPMPTAELLPSDLEFISDTVAARLRPDPDFDSDMARINDRLQGVMTGAGSAEW